MVASRLLPILTRVGLPGLLSSLRLMATLWSSTTHHPLSGTWADSSSSLGCVEVWLSRRALISLCRGLSRTLGLPLSLRCLTFWPAILGFSSRSPICSRLGVGGLFQTFNWSAFNGGPSVADYPPSLPGTWADSSSTIELREHWYSSVS